MLFPSIVKLVASPKPDLKKLVYVYLERYAEEQQELALLSISTFQRGLKDHNQVKFILIYSQSRAVNKDISFLNWLSLFKLTSTQGIGFSQNFPSRVKNLHIF